MDMDNSRARLLLTTHEIGHNLGARHDGESSCRQVSDGFIMGPWLNLQARNFSRCSLDVIDRRMERASCVYRIGPEPPPAPRVVGPEGPVSNPLPLFDWEPVDEAEAYSIEIFDETKGEKALSETVGRSSFRLAEPLSRGHDYRWRVSALLGTLEGEYSQWVGFNVDDLQAPRQLGPQGAVFTNRPLFQWEAVSGAEEYLLEIHDKTTDQRTELRVREAAFRPDDLLIPNHRYRWRVTASDSAGTGQSSLWLNFTPRPLRPALPPPRKRP